MTFYQIEDYTDAYSNGLHIAGGDRWPDAWVKSAADYRQTMQAAGRARLGQSYGPGARQVYDLFLPQGAPKGLMVFIHGGYWMSLDNSYWSHFAQGAVQHGYAVAMPGYDLCPQVRIRDIVQQIGAAITAAATEVPGPIAITGHSAGGHLTARMLSEGTPLPAEVIERVSVCLPISGLFDLRPLQRSTLNDTLQIDEAEARAESPALLRPVKPVTMMAWVGGAERAEFRRQNALLANVWTGLGARTDLWEEPDRHHFDVLDGLADPAHPMVKLLVGA